MANHSDLTRKEQVLAYLKEHPGWVDGPDISNETVGGSEGLKRLRELRADGHEIKMRQHPDPNRDIWQYRLVTQAAPQPDLPRSREWSQPTTPATPATVWEPAEKPYPKPEPTPQTQISSAVRRKEDGTYEYVPPQRPPEPELTEDPSPKFARLPAKIDFGEIAVCPRCHAKTKRGPVVRKAPVEDKPSWGRQKTKRRKTNEDAPTPMIDDWGTPLHRDPHMKKLQPCWRCNGYGIVPNIGPIALTVPTGTMKPEPLTLEEEAPTEEAFEL